MSTRRILILNLLIALIVVVGGVFGYYFYNQSVLYLQTDNAQVDGQQVAIIAPVAGQLVDWKGTNGTAFKANDSVGTVEVNQGGKTMDVPIKIPTDGTIVQNNAVQNQLVGPTLPLAYAYDLNHLWITANIKETSINDVKVGQSVDVYIDADPNVTFHGVVHQIGLATSSTFSLLPSSSSSGTFTKVTQVIPVVIELDGYQGSNLVPGMSASVRIHK